MSSKIFEGNKPIEALKIIKRKRVNISLLLDSGDVVDIYNQYISPLGYLPEEEKDLENNRLTQEEFDLLQEVLSYIELW